MKDSKESLAVESNIQRISGMLGFARKAGKTVIGTEMVCRMMPKKGFIKLVVIAGGASDSTKKKLTVKCEFYKIPSVVAEIDTVTLASLVGKSSAVAAVAVTDSGFAEEIKKAIAK